MNLQFWQMYCNTSRNVLQSLGRYNEQLCICTVTPELQSAKHEVRHDTFLCVARLVALLFLCRYLDGQTNNRSDTESVWPSSHSCADVGQRWQRDNSWQLWAAIGRY